MSFGYLFFNMNKRLCFAIGVEREQAWALEYDGSHWQHSHFCPVWWAVEHPAGTELPDREGLRQMLLRTIAEGFDALAPNPGTVTR